MMLTQTKLKKRESTCENARQKAVDVERSKAPASLSDALMRERGKTDASLLTYQQGAAMLQISLRQFRRLIDEKRIPFVIVSERVRRIRPSDIRDFVHQSTVRQE
jgi:excisionase family DNA binding protein